MLAKRDALDVLVVLEELIRNSAAASPDRGEQASPARARVPLVLLSSASAREDGPARGVVASAMRVEWMR